MIQSNRPQRNRGGGSGEGAEPPFAISDTTGLQAALDGKSANGHSHAIADTTGLQSALDGKAAATHNQDASTITTGTMAAARLGSGSPTSGVFLRGDSQWGGVSLGNLTQGALGSSVPLRHSQTATTGTDSAQPERFVAASALVDNIPPSWSYLLRISGSNYLAVSAQIISLGTAQSGNTGAIGFWRSAVGFVLNSTAGLQNRIQNGGPQTIPTGGSWITIGSVSGIAEGLLLVLVTGIGYAWLRWDGTTLTKESGATNLVVTGSPSDPQIGIRVSGTSLQLSNPTGTARNASNPLAISH